MKLICNLVLVVVLLGLLNAAYVDYVLTYSGIDVENTFQGKAETTTFVTKIDNKNGIVFTETELKGPTSILVYTLKINGDSYTATANATFGDDVGVKSHYLYYQTINTGYITTGNGWQHYTAYFNITGGEGAFFGAAGRITSNLIYNTTSREFNDLQVGRIDIPVSD